jgi:hypothetical protein
VVNSIIALIFFFMLELLENVGLSIFFDLDLFVTHSNNRWRDVPMLFYDLIFPTACFISSAIPN